MGKIYHLFPGEQNRKAVHTLSSANELVSVVSKLTEEAIKKSEDLSLKLHYVPKDSSQAQLLMKAYDEVIVRWTEKVHRLGGVAKGLWLVDFDSGDGYYYCWRYPETSIEYTHPYESGFKQRKRILPKPSLLGTDLQSPPPALV